ncbi:AMP-dependent synthetase/ligase [Rhodoligotrophos defluvii]|uniref:AMP-dependent synthetase/ligase n=1 Tax=Rhodoligotrophos defluvii TaxID=2561934 RepID=UPI0010C9CB65|nr:AMP-binding protein [Rhodoligotrophos defluvii]
MTALSVVTAHAPVVDRRDPTSADVLAAGDTTTPRLLRHRARLHGTALALREKEHGCWKRYDWAHYERQARRFAFALMSLGLRRGDRIAIASENTPEWYYADLGAEMLGIIPVGIYPTNPWPELQYIVRHCGAKLAVCGDQEQTDKVLDARANGEGLPDLATIACVDMKGMRSYAEPGLMSFEQLLHLGDVYLSDHPGAEAELDAAIDATMPDDTALMVYTSGTTGPPKGAMLSHRNIISSTWNYARAVGMDRHPFEVVGYLPLCHAAERCYSMVMQLVLGGVVNFAESIDTVALNVREIAPTMFIGVPRIWEKLKENFEYRLSESGPIRRQLATQVLKLGRRIDDRRQTNGGQLSLVDRMLQRACHLALFRNVQRHVGLDRTVHRLCAGASVSPETLRFFSVIGLPVSQGYGMTESAGCVFIQRGEHHRLGGCGIPIDGAKFKIADDGEILLGGPYVFKGYFRDEKATAATLDGEWLKTGDIVTQLDNGEIAMVDRKKAIIITSGGKNIAPSEIENALKDSPYIKEVIVVGEGRKFLGALVQIDFDNVGRWASSKGLPYTTYRSLTELPEVQDLVQREVDRVNGLFARVENIRKFVILQKELDHDDGELTATQKVRRSMIDKKFAAELKAIYGE